VKRVQMIKECCGKFLGVRRDHIRDLLHALRIFSRETDERQTALDLGFRETHLPHEQSVHLDWGCHEERLPSRHSASATRWRGANVTCDRTGPGLTKLDIVSIDRLERTDATPLALEDGDVIRRTNTDE
jgi:hypothetical protein